MGVTIGPNAYEYACTRDANRIKDAERLSTIHLIEARMARKNERLQEQINFEEVEGLLYGPGIAD